MIILREETVSQFSDESPILENPSSYELGKLWRSMELAANDERSIRFIADAKKKKFYAFDGERHLHYEAARKIPSLRGINVEEPPVWIITGIGVFREGKIDAYPYPQESPAVRQKRLSLDWDFANRYLIEPISQAI